MKRVDITVKCLPSDVASISATDALLPKVLLNSRRNEAAAHYKPSPRGGSVWLRKPDVKLPVREFSFAVYQFRVGRPNGKEYTFDEAEAVNAYDSIKKALSGAVEAETTEKTHVEMSTVTSNATKRFVCGLLEGGTHGERRAIASIDKKTRKAKRSTKIIEDTEAALNTFFFYIYVPQKGRFGFLILQQRGLISNYTYMSSILKHALDTESLAFRPARVAPPEYEEAINKGSLKKITLTRYRVPGKGPLGFEKLGNFDEVAKMTVTLEAERDFSMDSFRGFVKTLSGKKKGVTGHIAIEGVDFEPNKAKFSFKLNGREFSASTDFESAGRPAFVQDFNYVTQKQVFDDMKEYSEEIVKALLSV